VPKDLRRASAEELAAEAAAARPEFVVLTGGEPCIHDLGPLLTALQAVGLPAHLETCGAYPIAEGLAWVTVSPKWAKPPLPASLQRADEVKLIVETPESIARWTAAVGGTWHSRHVWLHPEWSQRAQSEVLRAITDQVKSHGAPFRAGWQVHKPYSADSLDRRARPPAPLGGDPAKGF
jgi:organic radical activating enzyme